MLANLPDDALIDRGQHTGGRFHPSFIYGSPVKLRETPSDRSNYLRYMTVGRLEFQSFGHHPSIACQFKQRIVRTVH
jgi:hypothetical protein